MGCSEILPFILSIGYSYERGFLKEKFITVKTKERHGTLKPIYLKKLSRKNTGKQSLGKQNIEKEAMAKTEERHGTFITEK